MKNKNHFLTITCSFLTLFLYIGANNTLAQSAYSDYGYADRYTFYEEKFDEPDESWETYLSGKSQSKIEYGALVYTSLNDKAHAKYTTVDGMDWNKDWELEVRLRRVYGKETSSSDIIWDRESGNSNNMHFGFTGNGKYNVSEYVDEYKRIVDFTYSDHVNKEDYNKLTVRKVRANYYYFFNNQFIGSSDYKQTKGDYVGFMVPPNSKIEVDYIRVSYLEKNYSTVSTADVDYDINGSFQKEAVYREDFDVSSSTWEPYTPGERMGRVHDGYLNWISFNESAYSISHTLDDMDWSRDWQIETRMMHLDGKQNSSNDLTWNNNDEGSYHFGFTAEGKYVLSKLESSGYNPIVPFTSSYLINTDGFNKMTIRKIGDIYYYFINETLISAHKGHTVSSNKIGLMVPPNSTLQVDYLEVTYLNSGANYSTKSQKQGISSQTQLSKPTSIKQRLVGSWSLKSNTENSKIIFSRSGFAEIIADNVSIGGANTIDESTGAEYSLVYEIDESQSPMHIDFIFMSGGMEIGRMKGIFDLVNNNSIKIKVAESIDQPRPVSLNESETFTRIRSSIISR